MNRDSGYNLRKADWKFRHGIKVNGQYLFNSTEKVYHYTTIDKFWLLINNDTFWATDVRFSNDWLEREAGMKLIKDVHKGLDKWNPGNFYMICFCREDDLLSQWREYGKAGVSVEMDFSREQQFTILTNEENKSATKDVMLYAKPVDVLYTDINSGIMHNSAYLQKVMNIKDIIKEYKKLRKKTDDFCVQTGLGSLCAYIKHQAFAEELETRLIFNFPKVSSSEPQHIWYRDNEGRKVPYLRIKYGDTDSAGLTCECSYVDIGEDIDSIFSQSIEAELKRKFPSIKTFDKVKRKDIYISAGTDQESVFKTIHTKITNSARKDINIWCDGHWPIRSIYRRT